MFVAEVLSLGANFGTFRGFPRILREGIQDFARPPFLYAQFPHYPRQDNEILISIETSIKIT